MSALPQFEIDRQEQELRSVFTTNPIKTRLRIGLIVAGVTFLLLEIGNNLLSVAP